MKILQKMLCLLLALALLPMMAFAEAPEETAVQMTETDPNAEVSETEEPEEEVDRSVAVIYAPRTGKATLRKKASKKSDPIRQCKAGMIVDVLEYGEKFTKISYKEKEGYILTSCLEFHASTEESIGEGVLSYQGKAKGTTTINIRNKADKESKKVAEWKTGTEVMVYGEQDGWVDIAADGMRGWVMEEFLTMKDELEEPEE